MVLVSRCRLTMITVPIIAVFTKYDVLVSTANIELRSTQGENEGEDMYQRRCQDHAWNDIQSKCVQQLPGISCIPVSTSMSLFSLMKYSSFSSPDKMPETLEKLVQITIEQIKALDPPEGQIPVTDAQHAGPPARSPWTKRLKDRLRPGSHQNVQHPKLDACHSDSTELSDSTRAGAAFAMAQRVDMPSKIKASIE